MKDNLKYYIKFIIKFFLLFFYLFPIKYKRIYFISFHGARFSCNPKYLYLHFLEKYGLKYQYVWELKDIKKKSLIPDSICVKIKSVKSFYYLLTSRYIITNNDLAWYIPFRKKQLIVQTWHAGGAYKKVGKHEAWDKVFIKEQKKCAQQVTYCVSSCRKFTEIQSSSKWFPEEKFINTGLPRNEIFFYSDRVLNSKKKVFEYFNLKFNVKVLLYAPTFRGKPQLKAAGTTVQYGIIKYLSVLQNLKDKFDGEWVLLYRGHHVDEAVARQLPDSVVDATKYEDMQELLCAADVLLTDFSSSMWDFALTGKPCFLYAPDLQQYIADRGFYTDPFTWPFPMAQNDAELARNILSFDETTYKKAVEKHLSDFGSYENKDACAKVCQAIGIE